MFLSRNGGDTWTPRSTGLPAGQAVNALAVFNRTIILAGLWNGEIYYSPDSGLHWSRSNPSTTWSYISDITIDKQNNILVGTGYNGVLRSTDAGSSWQLVNQGLGSLTITSVYSATSQYLFASTFDGGLFRSSNNGDNWSRVADSVFPSRCEGIVVTKNGKLIVGTWGYGVFRSKETILEVRDKKMDSPVSFTLFQNYPNPANPVTWIKFSVGHHTRVSLSIFNLLGQEVETLFVGEAEPGVYALDWNTFRVSSGVYYYRLQAGGLSQTRKLLVVK